MERAACLVSVGNGRVVFAEDELPLFDNVTETCSKIKFEKTLSNDASLLPVANFRAKVRRSGLVCIAYDETTSIPSRNGLKCAGNTQIAGLLVTRVMHSTRLHLLNWPSNAADTVFHMIPSHFQCGTTHTHTHTHTQIERHSQTRSTRTKNCSVSQSRRTTSASTMHAVACSKC